MAQIDAPGGGIIDSGDKRITRKVVVSTGGSNPSAPGGEGRLTNATITEEAAGIRRGIFEYTVGGGGDATYDQYGKRVELIGGSREVSVFNHPKFKTLSSEEILEVQNAAEERPRKKTDFSDASMNDLYQCLIRQVEYYIAPSLVARVSEIESVLPSIDGLCKISNPAEVSKPGQGEWILTGINASPLGDKYEVTREYTYIEQPEVAQFLYE